jgi:hypothetical protein
MKYDIQYAIDEGFIILYWWQEEAGTRVKGRLYHVPKFKADIKHFDPEPSEISFFGYKYVMNSEFYRLHGIETQSREEAIKLGDAWTASAKQSQIEFKKNFADVQNSDL